MKGHLLALISGVALLGCRGTTVTKSGVGSVSREAECDFQIYTAVPTGYVEVATVDFVPGLAAPYRNLGDFKDHIRPAVCAAGGDAAVAWMNGLGTYIKATVIRKVAHEPASAARLSEPQQANNTTDSAEAAKLPEHKGFPHDALGFEFDSTPEEAQELCTSLDHEWRMDGESYQCTGAAVNVGAPVATTLSYCGGLLCEVRAYVTLAKDSVGQREFVKLQKALIKQYGEPAKTDVKVPTDCHDRLTTCIVEGKAKWQARWEWPDGSNIRAKAGTDGTSPIIGIRYHWVRPKSDSAPPDAKADDASSFDAEGF